MGEAGITVIWIGGIALLAWFLFIRPRRRMVARQRDLLSTLSGGSEDRQKTLQRRRNQRSSGLLRTSDCAAILIL